MTSDRPACRRLHIEADYCVTLPHETLGGRCAYSVGRTGNDRDFFSVIFPASNQNRCFSPVTHLWISRLL